MIVSIAALGQAIGIGLLPAASATAAPVAATAMTVASGRVELAGQPVAGAQTVLYAWPANSVLAKLTPGQAVPVTVIGTTTTDSSGQYAVPQARTAGLAAGPGGTVNLEAVTLTPGGFASYSFSRTLSQLASGFPALDGCHQHRYETQFRNAEYGYSCSHGFLSYETRPSSFAGGARGISTGYPKATYCVYQEKGSTFTENTSTAYTFGAGAFISEIGLNTTAQTGFDHPRQLVVGRV